MKNRGISRREFLKGTGVLAAGAAASQFPTILRAAPKEILIGAVEPLTGTAAEAGQMATWGLELAIDHINNRIEEDLGESASFPGRAALAGEGFRRGAR